MDLSYSLGFKSKLWVGYQDVNPIPASPLTDHLATVPLRAVNTIKQVRLYLYIKEGNVLFDDALNTFLFTVI